MIYFIECKGRVKIGFSENPYSRFSKINSDAPYQCTLIGVLHGDRAREAEIHCQFSDDREHGEWFRFTVAMNNFIAANAIDAKPERKRPKIDHPVSGYIVANKISVSDFAVKAKLSRVQLYRVMKGEAKKLSTLRNVSAATDGEVTIQDLIGAAA